ncbi:hypothetical protein [Thermoflexus sp.]
MGRHRRSARPLRNDGLDLTVEVLVEGRGPLRPETLQQIGAEIVEETSS